MTRTMTRKQFLRDALGLSAAALGLAVLSSACGTSSPSPMPEPTPNPPPDAPGGGVDAASPNNCLANGTDVTIETNHGHILVVTKEDVAAGVDKSYDIQGSADHTHTVTVTASDFMTLAANNAITTASTFNNSATFGTHDHTILVACA